MKYLRDSFKALIVYWNSCYSWIVWIRYTIKINFTWFLKCWLIENKKCMWLTVCFIGMLKVLWPIMSEVRKTVLRDLVCTYVCIETPRSPAKMYFTAWVSSSVSKRTVPLDHLLAFYGTIEFANPVRISSTFFILLMRKLEAEVVILQNLEMI